MDYEKKYKEALEWARKVMQGKVGFVLDEVLEKFPELTESEDERIRKEIIEVIESLSLEKEYEYIAWLEKQGEQKPAEKVERKFKVGDWLVENEPNNYSRFVQILEVVDVQGKDRYRISRDIHNDEDIVEFDFVEKYYHKFDIQDAKDGDMLCDYYEAFDNPLIFILKKFEHVNFGLVRPSDYSSYCFLTADNKQKFKEGTYHHERNIKPATKEQRDLLFQKMKEAGYEWNAEKKELKKIEQKPAEWNRNDEVLLYETLHFIREFQQSDRCIDEGDMQNSVTCENWLKSLKDKVQPKPKQEWKQENNGDLTDFEIAMMHIGGSFFGENAGLDPNDTNAIKEQANILLRLVPKQEWSEEDKEIIDYLIDYLESELDSSYTDLDKETFTKEINWLKSLRPQNTLKPSDEQMTQLKRYCPDNRPLTSLYEQLKKLREE